MSPGWLPSQLLLAVACVAWFFNFDFDCVLSMQANLVHQHVLHTRQRIFAKEVKPCKRFDCLKATAGPASLYPRDWRLICKLARTSTQQEWSSFIEELRLRMTTFVQRSQRPVHQNPKHINDPVSSLFSMLSLSQPSPPPPSLHIPSCLLNSLHLHSRGPTYSIFRFRCLPHCMRLWLRWTNALCCLLGSCPTHAMAGGHIWMAAGVPNSLSLSQFLDASSSNVFAKQQGWQAPFEYQSCADHTRISDWGVLLVSFLYFWPHELRWLGLQRW